MSKRSKRRPVNKKKEPVELHAARLKLHVHELTRAGSALTLRIYADKTKLGEMIIGRGGLFWYGARRQKREHISWTHFAERMDELAYHQAGT